MRRSNAGKLGGDRLGRRRGIRGLGDRATDHQVGRPRFDGARGRHHPLLIAHVGTRGPDAGNDAGERGGDGADPRELFSAAHDAGATGLLGRARADLHELRRCAGVAGLLAGRAILARQHRHREDAQLVARLLDARREVPDAAARVDGQELHTQVAAASNRAAHRVRDVVELEVEEDVDLGHPLAERPHDRRPLGDEQLESHLEHPDLVRQTLGERQRRGGIGNIERDDDTPVRRSFHAIHGRVCSGSGLEFPRRWRNAPRLTVRTDPRQALFEHLEEDVRGGVFPGCVALVWHAGATLYHEAHGVLATHPWSKPWHDPVTRDTVYDLASLTKVLCTTTLAAIAVAEGRLALDAPVPGEWARGCPGATLEHLLAHDSGVPAHAEYFREIAPFDRDAVLAAIARTEPAYPRSRRAVYSDLGFIVLGAWLERAFDQPLEVAFEDRVLYPLGLHDRKRPPLAFRPLAHDPAVGRNGNDSIAPTEVYDPALHPAGVPSHFAVRERFAPDAHGAVHDDNAFVMGGIAGHAGLFGTAEAVLTVARAWLEGSLGSLSPTVRDRFWTRSATPGSSRCLGFDGHSGADSSAGPRLDARAVGHTGFTGTSLWIDPAAHAIYVLLSNRVHPQRDHLAIRAARPRFHTAAARLVGAS